MITRPNDNLIDAHFFPKEGATHAPDDAKFLLSSKGTRTDVPLARSCGLFNGIDNSIDFEELALQGDYSISFWTLDAEGDIIVNRNGVTGSAFTLTSSAQFTVAIGANLFFDLDLTFNFAVWNHVALTREFSSGDVFLYINGVKQTDEENSTSTPNYGRWGARGDDVLFMSGKLYDGRFHNTPLTAEQVLNVMNFLPSGAEILQHALEEKAGNVAYDSSGSLQYDTVTYTSTAISALTPALGMQIVGNTIVYDGLAGGTRTQLVTNTIPNGTFGTYRVSFKVTAIGGANESLFVIIGTGEFDRVEISSIGTYELDLDYTIGGNSLGFTNAGFGASPVNNDTSWTIEGITTGDISIGINPALVPNGNHGTINGDLSNFWYEGADVPFSFANKVGYGDGRDFDGVSNLTQTTNFGANDFEFEIEWNLFGRSKSASYALLQHSTNNNFRLSIDSNALTSCRFVTNGNQTVGTFLTDVSSKWVTLKVTRVGNDISIFEDGTLIGQGLGDTGDAKWNSVGDRGTNNGSGFPGVIRKLIVNGTNIDLFSLPIGHGNVGGYRASSTELLDANGDTLSNPGQVRHRARVKNVNVGVFDGLAGEVRVPHSDDLAFKGAGVDKVFSITGWVKPTALLSVIINKNNAGEGLGVDYYMHFTNSGTLRINLVDGSGTLIARETTGVAMTNNWYFIAGTYAATQVNGGLRVYLFDVNGNNLTGAMLGTGSGYTGMVATVGELTFGEQLGTFYSQEQSDMRIHNVELSEAQVDSVRYGNVLGTEVGQWGYSESSGVTVHDLAGNDNNGTWQGHVDPNQWGKSDDVVDQRLFNKRSHGFSNPTAKYFQTGSTIDFNPQLALGANVPTDYIFEGLVPADAYLYMNQTFVESAYSIEAQAAIDNMQISTPYEREAVAQFVEELKAQGNYGLIDDIMLLGLRGDASLKSMKGIITPVNNGGVYVEGVGYQFNGAEYIDTGFNPTTSGLPAGFNGSSGFVGLGTTIGAMTAKGVAFSLILKFRVEGSIGQTGYLLHSNVSGTDAFAITMTSSSINIARYNGGFFQQWRIGISLNTEYTLELDWDGGGNSGTWTKKEVNGVDLSVTGSGFSGTNAGAVVGVNISTAANFFEGNIYSLEIAGQGKWTAANNWIDEIASNDGTPTDLTGVTKYSLNDALTGAYIVNVDTVADFICLFSSGVANQIQLYQRPGTGNLEHWINTGSSTDNAVDGGKFIDNTLYTISRSASNVSTLYKNGISAGAGNKASSSINNDTVDIGRRKDGNFYLIGIVGSFVIGAGVGFDQAAYYRALRIVQVRIELGNRIEDILLYKGQLLTASQIKRLYAFINEPMGQLGDLQDYEARALDNFIRNERSVGT